MTNKNNNDIDAKIYKLVSLNKDKADLWVKLKRSLAMERRFPGCFDLGSVVPKVTSRQKIGGRNHHLFPTDFKMTVETQNGPVTVDGKDEPETLIEILGKDFGSSKGAQFDANYKTNEERVTDEQRIID